MPHACFQLNYSYHILTASAQPNKNKTTVIASAINSIVIHASPEVISHWINTTKTIALQLSPASPQGSSTPTTPKKVHHQTNTP
jgi:hypothetical protein